MLDATFLDNACFELHTVFECTADTFPEMTVCGGPKGVTFEGMDNSHVALMKYTVPAEQFSPSNYMCERSISIGLKSAALRTIFKMVDKDTKSLTMRYDSVESAHILQIFIAHNANRVSEFSVLLSSLTPYQADTPQLSYSAEVIMPSINLQRACQDFRQFHDCITLKLGMQKDGKDLCMTLDNIEGFFGKGALSEQLVYKSTDDETTHIDEKTSALCASYARLMTKFQGPTGAFIEIGNEGDTGSGAYRFVADEQGSVNALPSEKNDLFSQLGRDDAKGPQPMPEVTEYPEKQKRDKNDLIVALVDPIETLKFSLRFMSAFSRAHRCSKTVAISLKQNCPCRLEYAAGSTGVLVFYLAPNAS